MQTQSNALNFTGQNIYVGIDVHKKSWNVTILLEQLHHKTFTQPPLPSALVSYLNKNFPGGTYHSVYEAGFSGLWSHYELTTMGIKNIVVNPADVPITQKEKLQKTDSIDSRKLARCLRSGALTGIYIPIPQTLEARSLIRTRSMIVKDIIRMKNRIKSLLFFYGVSYPPSFEKSTSHWTHNFIKWLSSEITFPSDRGNESLSLLVSLLIELRKHLLEATRKIRALSCIPEYKEPLRLIRTVPGIGLITGMTFLTEIEDISRFHNSDKLAGFVGLVPTSHSSGEKEGNGEMCFRGQPRMRSMLLESSWIAARIDPALSMCFSNAVKRMHANKAIVKIARKLLNRIFYVIKYKQEYVCSVVK